MCCWICRYSVVGCSSTYLGYWDCWWSYDKVDPKKHCNSHQEITSFHNLPRSTIDSFNTGEQASLIIFFCQLGLRYTACHQVHWYLNGKILHDWCHCGINANLCLQHSGTLFWFLFLLWFFRYLRVNEHWLKIVTNWGNLIWQAFHQHLGNCKINQITNVSWQSEQCDMFFTILESCWNTRMTGTGDNASSQSSVMFL